MNEYQVVLILNFSLAAGLIWWVERSVYGGNKRILYFLIILLPVPTLFYLYILSKMTDQLKKRKG